MPRILNCIILILILILTACTTDPVVDTRLISINEVCVDNPREALTQLSKIDVATLTGRDRYYHNLLVVKALDKAYIVHTSDTLIRGVIDYYAVNHRGTDLYAEALYYGGRVYSDLGDYPTALNLFHQSVNLLPEDTDRPILRAVALSQTGRLLNTIRLYDEAIPFLREAIKTDSIINDSVGLMYDNQLLGAIYLHKKEYDIAESKFQYAKVLAQKLSPQKVYLFDLYLAAVKLNKNELESARQLIKTVIYNVDSLSRDNALAYAAQIYLQSNILDTAYVYAQEIAQRATSPCRRSGYQVLLSPQFRGKIPVDSVYSYIDEYERITEDQFNENQRQASLLQQSAYNYQLHDEKRAEAEQSRDSLRRKLFFSILMVLILMLIILYIRDNNKNTRLQLHEALDNIKELRMSLASDSNKMSSILNSDVNSDLERSESLLTKAPNIENLKSRLRDELLALQRAGSTSTDISPTIINSMAYAQLQSLINSEKVIADSNPLWDEIEAAVISASPDFKYHLQLLTGGSLKAADYHLALLVKCGVTPTQMSSLVGRAKGTISYRREALCQKIFGEKLGVKVIDDVIRLL